MQNARGRLPKQKNWENANCGSVYYSQTFLLYVGLKLTGLLLGIYWNCQFFNAFNQGPSFLLNRMWRWNYLHVNVSIPLFRFPSFLRYPLKARKNKGFHKSFLQVIVRIFQNISFHALFLGFSEIVLISVQSLSSYWYYFTKFHYFFQL